MRQGTGKEGSGLPRKDLSGTKRVNGPSSDSRFLYLLIVASGGKEW